MVRKQSNLHELLMKVHELGGSFCYKIPYYVHVDDLLYTVTCCVLSCTLHTYCATCCAYCIVGNFCGVQIFVGFKMW